MDSEIIFKIDSMIEASREKLVRDTIRLVNIKSVMGDPMPEAPFGRGPKAVLDEIMRLGQDMGLYGIDYGVGVVSLSYYDAPIDVGIWLHGDVVPEGDGWSFSPYDAVEYGECVIGRGSADNKGQLAAIYNLLLIFKELGIKLKYNPAIFVGSDEECGMRDIIGMEENPEAKGFLAVAKPPRLSLVPDGGFPLGYGGKGGLTLTLQSRKSFENMTFTAGKSEAPGTAEAELFGFSVCSTLDKCDVFIDGNRTVVSSYSPPCHGAHPDPNGNMITQLSAALIGAHSLGEKNERILEFLHLCSLDTQGKALGIYTKNEEMGELSVFAKAVKCVDGIPSIVLNIRYPIGITFEEIIEKITRVADEWDFVPCDVKRGVNAYTVPHDTPIPKMLTTIANEVYKTDAAPFTMGGGTYAHRLPNAFVYGSASNRAPADFAKGRGGAHGVDEAVSIPRLILCMKTYARALLSLDLMTDEF